MLLAVGFALSMSLSVAVAVRALRTGSSLLAALSVSAVATTNVATLSVSEPGPVLLTGALASWVLMLAVFPDGVPRPRWMVWLLGVEAVALLSSLVVPGIDGLRVPAFVAGFAAGSGAQLWRYQRRSSTNERQAAKWLLAGLVPAIASLLGGGVIASTTSLGQDLFESGAYTAVSAVSIWLVPAGAAAGLLLGDRGRIDDLLRGEIVVVTTVTLVAWAYFAAVPPVGTTTAAAIAALLVVPTSRITTTIANRLVYGRDAAMTLSAVSGRLQSTVAADDVAAVVAESITDGLAVPYAAVRLRGGELAATAGAQPTGAAMDRMERFTVSHLGRQVAEIEVAPRPAEVALHRRDRSALESLAAHAGPALHGADVQRELATAYERLALAREEERGRVRRDLHDDLAPTLAGIGLRAAAAAAVESTNPERARQLHADVQAGIRDAVAQVREIAHDLRPSMLDDGLEPALRRRLATDEDDSLAVTLDVSGMPAVVPAAVELAALRIVQEAVTNVRRHAEARRCEVIIAASADALKVRVTDDGRGLPDQPRPRLGLVSLEQRARALGGVLSIRPLDGGGTALTAVLPLNGSDLR
jgi:signal transduction histidine kinase